MADCMSCKLREGTEVRDFAERLTTAHLTLPADRQKSLAIPLPCSQIWPIACCASWQVLLAAMVVPEGEHMQLACMSMLLQHVKS